MMVRFWLVVLAFLLGGCGIPADPSTHGADELELIVLPDSAGRYPADLMVGCPSGPSFPYSALAEIPELSDAAHEEIEKAIQPFLESDEGVYWPQTGWRLLHLTGDQALLVHHDDSEGVSFMTAQREGDGWRWSGASGPGGNCQLQSATPSSLNTVEWRLDEEAPPPIPDTRRVDLLLHERECVSGQPIGDRLVGPEVIYTDTEVLIAFAATPPPGDAQNCQGNPEMAYTVELDEVLGDRTLRDGRALGISLEDFLQEAEVPFSR